MNKQPPTLLGAFFDWLQFEDFEVVWALMFLGFLAFGLWMSWDMGRR
jgi:hypothetical protein